MAFGSGNLFSHKTCRGMFEMVCSTISDLLAEGRSVNLPGIGTLKPVTLPPMEKYCALTERVVKSPARRSVKFRPSPVIKKELNKEVGK